jgi:sec-independent protein translocase protein TatB
MFDIGFWELIFILVVTLLVVGPERLPRVARTAGLWLGKARGFVTSVKADIDKELAAEELKRTLAKQAQVPELEEIIEEVDTDLRSIDSGATAGGENPPQEEATPPDSLPGTTDEPQRK